MGMSTTRITIEEVIHSTDGAYWAEVRLAKERMTLALLSQLVEDPARFTLTTDDAGEVVAKLSVVVVSLDEMTEHAKQIEQIKLLIGQL